jgi:hypothetical protein
MVHGSAWRRPRCHALESVAAFAPVVDAPLMDEDLPTDDKMMKWVQGKMQ